MGSTIQTLSAVPEAWVRDYLRGQGQEDHVVEWKYFDRRFNRDRERGYVWVRDDRVRGFLGLIPFRLRQNGECRDVVWSCDWSVEDPEANPGIGILLLKKAIAESELLFSLAGNRQTALLLPRMAVKTVEDAALVFRRVFRLGVVMKKAGERIPGIGAWGRTALGKIPLSRVPRARAFGETETFAGVAPAIAALLDAGDEGDCYPDLDFDHVNWQIGRCPAITAKTCIVSAHRTPQAAVVYWRPGDATDRWRMVFWALAGARDALSAALAAAIRDVHREQGQMISAIVSRRDEMRITALEQMGFWRAGRLPLYVCAGADFRGRASELSRLNYLATDLGYRF
jgi:hypothetical protein